MSRANSTRRHGRRRFLATLGASAVALRARAAGGGPAVTAGRTRDVVVVGAGCFGAWTAWQLRAAGRSVLLVDQYGPANARSSSGGESRAILESRGFKIANDTHGPALDPDTGERAPTPEALAEARAFMEERFPGMRGAPLVESRVCQYENTSNGDFVIDRHPGFDNVWLCGGGSGHGFKHGPAVGEFTAQRVLKGDATDPRFTLASKKTEQQRSVH